jgi:hypothetical protein
MLKIICLICVDTYYVLMCVYFCDAKCVHTGMARCAVISDRPVALCMYSDGGDDAKL